MHFLRLWSGIADGTIAWLLAGVEDGRFLSAAGKANSYLQVRRAAVVRPAQSGTRSIQSLADAAILSRPRSGLQCRLLCGLEQFAENRLIDARRWVRDSS